MAQTRKQKPKRVETYGRFRIRKKLWRWIVEERGFARHRQELATDKPRPARWVTRARTRRRLDAVFLAKRMDRDVSRLRDRITAG